ncbi:restriction endonuclease subunit S [Undibacterium sp. Jales W-56]|uniref:restriction endonuclease subunit S n=1 Tax=Undibacterium sp. Jales W-56 TaxID=2897325 RepID=UPI0021CF3C3E|nr:restriction endonuclease subunit S [Undibacterium sp. Jales W-56]MCU6434619.1 restriction endonuclease subunit S [Undibacterium sp. Jales W-56]
MIEKILKPGWKVWRFDQMATNVNVRIDNPSESGMEHYVGLEHLDADSLKIRRWGTPHDVEATKLMFKKGDIIFGRRRAYQRKLGVAQFDGVCSAHAMVVRAKPEVVLREFLPFFMQSDLFMDRAVEISVGSLSPTINWKTMAVQEFALPLVDEQRRLVGIFDALEEISESLGDATAASTVLKSSLAERTFPISEVRTFLEAPDAYRGRPLVRLGDIATLQVGFPFKSAEYAPHGDRLLRGSNVGVNRLIWDDAITCYWPVARRHEVSNYVLNAGDLVIAMDRPFIAEGFKIARIAESDLPALLLQRVGRFRLTGEITPEYLWAFLHSESFKWQLQRMQKGTDLPHISRFDIEGTLIPVLTLDEQTAVADHFAAIESAGSMLLSRWNLGCKQKKNALRELIAPGASNV